MGTGRRWLRRLGPHSSPLVFLLPAAVFLLAVIAYPIGRIFVLSFHFSVLTRPELGVYFNGLTNYSSLVTDPSFWAAFQRTIGWTAASVGIKTVIGLAGGLLLYRQFPLRRLYLTLLLIPWVTPVVVGAIAWRWIYNGEFGRLNELLMGAGLMAEPISWLGQPLTAFWTTVMVDAWIGIPFMLLILMAGLQGIPQELYEAAAVDGAGPWHTFWQVTLPQLRPVLLVATTLSAVWTFNSFQVIWPLTRGGPVNATETLVVKTYRTAFGAFNFGEGAALAIVTFVFLLGFSLTYWRLLQQQEGETA